MFDTVSASTKNTSGQSDTESAKRKRFKSQAEQRANKVLEHIESIGGLADPHAYDYEEEDLRKIFDPLKRALALAEKRFGKAKSRNQIKL